jgi:hypothetical protein
MSLEYHACEQELSYLAALLASKNNAGADSAIKKLDESVDGLVSESVDYAT